MAIPYRHKHFGHVVEMPEPHEIEAAAQAEAENVLRSGVKGGRELAESIVDNGKLQAQRMRQVLAKWDVHPRFERYTPPPVAAPVEPVEAEQHVETKPARKATKASAESSDSAEA